MRCRTVQCRTTRYASYTYVKVSELWDEEENG